MLLVLYLLCFGLLFMVSLGVELVLDGLEFAIPTAVANVRLPRLLGLDAIPLLKGWMR